MNEERHRQLQALKQNSPAWHEARTLRVTASIVPSILSFYGARDCPEDVIISRLRRVLHTDQPHETSAAMRHGLDFENVAALYYSSHLQTVCGPEAKINLHDLGTMVHKELPSLSASPDRNVTLQKDDFAMSFYVLLKCPYSRPSSDFDSLREDHMYQVVTELAVIRSHEPEASSCIYPTCLPVYDLTLLSIFISASHQIMLNMVCHVKCSSNKLGSIRSMSTRMQKHNLCVLYASERASCPACIACIIGNFLASCQNCDQCSQDAHPAGASVSCHGWSVSVGRKSRTWDAAQIIIWSDSSTR